MNLNRLAEVPPEVLIDVVEACEGTTITSPESFVEAGIPEEFILPLVTTYFAKFDSQSGVMYDPKGTPVESLRGISDLDFLDAVCRELEVDPEIQFTSRKAMAEALRARVKAHLGRRT